MAINTAQENEIQAWFEAYDFVDSATFKSDVNTMIASYDSVEVSNELIIDEEDSSVIELTYNIDVSDQNPEEGTETLFSRTRIYDGRSEAPVAE